MRTHELLSVRNCIFLMLLSSTPLSLACSSPLAIIAQIVTLDFFSILPASDMLTFLSESKNSDKASTTVDFTSSLVMTTEVEAMGYLFHRHHRIFLTANKDLWR